MTNTGQMVNAYVAGRGNLSAEDQALVARRARALGPAPAAEDVLLVERCI